MPEADLTLLQAIDAHLDAKRGEGRAESGIRRCLVSRRAIEMSALGNRLVREVGAKDIEGYMGWRKQKKWRALKRAGGSRTDPNITVQVKGAKPSNVSVNRDVALVSAALGGWCASGSSRGTSPVGSNVAAMRGGRFAAPLLFVVANGGGNALLRPADCVS